MGIWMYAGKRYTEGFRYSLRIRWLFFCYYITSPPPNVWMVAYFKRSKSISAIPLLKDMLIIANLVSNSSIYRWKHLYKIPTASFTWHNSSVTRSRDYIYIQKNNYQQTHYHKLLIAINNNKKHNIFLASPFDICSSLVTIKVVVLVYLTNMNSSLDVSPLVSFYAALSYFAK